MSKSVAEILDAAADLIEPEGGWGQGSFGEHGVRRNGDHCASTAICRASDAQTRPAALDAFTHAIGAKNAWDIYFWNDDTQVTKWRGPTSRKATLGTLKDIYARLDSAMIDITWGDGKMFTGRPNSNTSLPVEKTAEIKKGAWICDSGASTGQQKQSLPNN